MFKKNMWILSGGLLLLAFLVYPAFFVTTTACTPAQQIKYQPIPQYTDLYSFPRYNVPEAKKAGSANVTVIVTVPRFKNTATQEYAGAPKMTAGGNITPEMVKVFDSFAGSMSEDIQAQLVAKGMTTMGPYDWDEITYPEKKESDLVSSVEVILDIHSSTPVQQDGEYFEGGTYGTVYAATLTVGTKVYFNLHEPLSGEKMWIKKIDLGVQDYPYKFAVGQQQYISSYQSDGCGGRIPIYSWRSTGNYVYDERAKIFSDVLKNAYPQLMKAAWNFLNTEEMQDLKLKSKEIRAKKVYGERPYQ
jgi:hypothetical protein